MELMSSRTVTQPDASSSSSGGGGSSSSSSSSSSSVTPHITITTGERTRPHPGAVALCRGVLEPLRKRKYVIIDHTLSDADAEKLAAEMARLKAHPAALEDSFQYNEDGSQYRWDRTLFANAAGTRAQGFPAIADTIVLLRGIGREVAEWADEPLTANPNAQIACYPGGGACYAVHSDNGWRDPSRKEQMINWRKYTVIMYANKDWSAERDGGALRLHLTYADGTREHVDVAPHAGRVVVFNAQLFHEVRPAYRSRFAITQWMWLEDGDASKAKIS
jgi:hypothetical protein